MLGVSANPEVEGSRRNANEPDRKFQNNHIHESDLADSYGSNTTEDQKSGTNATKNLHGSQRSASFRGNKRFRFNSGVTMSLKILLPFVNAFLPRSKHLNLPSPHKKLTSSQEPAKTNAVTSNAKNVSAQKYQYLTTTPTISAPSTHSTTSPETLKISPISDSVLTPAPSSSFKNVEPASISPTSEVETNSENSVNSETHMDANVQTEKSNQLNKSRHIQIQRFIAQKMEMNRKLLKKRKFKKK
jgi:hypothetical protein